MMHATRQCGFALLLVLMLAMVAAVALVSVARRSSDAAIEAINAREELQRRWAVTSCRQTLLDRAEILLDDAERGVPRSSDEEALVDQSSVYRNKPLPSLRVSCRLADCDYDLVFTDEQAKLSVNQLLDRHTPAEVGTIVNRMVMSGRSDGAERPAIRVRPVVASAKDGGVERSSARVDGYGQVFENEAPQRLIGDEREKGWTAHITCWSDGRVNVRRASDDVIRRAIENMVGPAEVRALLDARRQHPYRKLSALYVITDSIEPEQRQMLSQVLTDESMCHGLWVVAHGRQRSWYSLTIAAGQYRPDSDENKADPRVMRSMRRLNYTW